MAFLNRAQLDRIELRTQIIDVPEWRTPEMPPDETPQVLIRELMGSERDEYEASLLTMRGTGKKMQQEYTLKNARAKLAVKAMIDATGAQLYSNTAADIAAIGKLPARGLERIVDAIIALSGLREDDAELEERAANFPNGETAAFGTN